MNQILTRKLKYARPQTSQTDASCCLFPSNTGSLVGPKPTMQLSGPAAPIRHKISISGANSSCKRQFESSTTSSTDESQCSSSKPTAANFSSTTHCWKSNGPNQLQQNQGPCHFNAKFANWRQHYKYLNHLRASRRGLPMVNPSVSHQARCSYVLMLSTDPGKQAD